MKPWVKSPWRVQTEIEIQYLLGPSSMDEDRCTSEGLLSSAMMRGPTVRCAGLCD